MRIRYDTYATVFGTAYVALMANLLLVVACLPLIAGLLLTDHTHTWPLLTVITPLCAPGLCGVFAVLAAFTSYRSTTVLPTFVRAWRASWRRATSLGAVSCGAVVVFAVDIRAVWGQPIGALVIPLLVVLILLTVSVALLGFVVLAERPTARLRDVLRASAYLAVRRWYLTVASLVVLALLGQLVAVRPAVALGLAATPLLYIVWANSRFTLRPALDPTAAVPAPPGPGTPEHVPT
jgi:uncharacterized membrane protein YesL